VSQDKAVNNSTSIDRDAGFDAVKGVLVVVMVAYHVLSIATSAGEEAFRYMRFLSGSFIFISGFVVVRFMWDRFSRAPADTSIRLVTRGLKVLVIFTMLNLAIHVSGFGNASKTQLGAYGLLANATDIFLLGDSKQSSFLILLPIAYLMIVTPVFMAAAQRSPTMVPIVLLAAALAMMGLTPEAAPIAGFMQLGLCSLCLGAPALANRVLGTGRPPLWVTLCGLVVAVAVAGRVGGTPVLYVLGVAFILRFLHDAMHWLPRRWLDVAALIGRYSLPAYIGQILLIQCAFRAFFSERGAPDWHAAALMIFVTAATVAMCVVIERARLRSPVADRTYRWIFA
jgi:peptidoglycan/LPS O-acetylase OafA/YrhL